LELRTFPATLGRVTRTNTPGIGIVDPSSNVGREHATIDHRNGGFSIRDTSQNGTWVNGIRLKREEKTVLLDGAEISLANGSVVLRFHSGEQTVMQSGKGNWST
jgi:predicted component of type VI protein secretion system